MRPANLTISDAVLNILSKQTKSWTVRDLYVGNTTLDNPRYVFAPPKSSQKDEYSLETFRVEVDAWAEEKNFTSKEEAMNYTFEAFDVNKDEKIDMDEFVNFTLNMSKQNPEKEDIKAIFPNFDLNGDLVVDKDQFRCEESKETT